MTIKNLRAYFARRSPETSIKVERLEAEEPFEIVDQDGEVVASGRSHPAMTRITLSRRPSTYPSCTDGIAFGALRRATPSVRPTFYDVASVTIVVVAGDRVQSCRHHGGLAFSYFQWQQVDEEDFAAMADELDERERRANERNIATSKAARQHPASIAAQEQIGRQRAILANIPTEDADRYLAEHMGYSYEQQAGWGRTVRTRRRKEARQAMTANMST